MNGAVSVIVPVWNRRELLERLLGGLRAQTQAIAEVLVLDNGSRDGSAEAGERHGARVIRMGANLGFSRAVNRGIQECRTPWLAIVNNDIEPAPDWLRRLMEAAGDGIWFATGKILSASRRERIDGTWDALCRGGCAWRVGHGRIDSAAFAAGRRIRLAPATAALFRSELFRKVGFFDEGFESYLEDVEFGLRCALSGCYGLYVPEAIAWHAGSATLGRWHPDSVRRMARNQVLLLARHYRTALLLRNAWPILIAQFLWGLVALRHSAGLAYLRGKISGIREFRGARGTPPPGSELQDILRQSEREIYDIQRRTGFDWYWRLYFLLTTGRVS